MDVNILACALFAVLIMSLVSLIYGIYKTRWIFRQPVENEKLLRISGYVSNGAMTFLGREYRVLIPFVLMVAVFLALANRGQLGFQALTFTLGAACSALAGFIGMKVATASNARTTSAAEKGLAPALLLSFTGGSVMGLSVVGLALLGLFAVLSAVIIIFTGRQTQAMTDIGLPLLTGFSMGASSIALFTRVGGGIYTKAADIGADLVGKLEANIPEDDPRNPATIADNVGDNVGDVAGMGADLFESYVGTIVGCIILGQTAIVSPEIRTELVALPLLLSALGVVGSIIGIRLVGRGAGISPQASLNRGSYTAALIAALGAYPLFWYILGDHRVGQAGFNQIYLSFIVGLVAGVGIGMLTEYFTGMNRGPVNAIVKACETGPATTIITGIGIGMRSSFLTILIISAVLMLSYLMAGLYGLGISALGMLCTLGIQLAVDAYGPIADNAGGLAEMAELPPEVRSITDQTGRRGKHNGGHRKRFCHRIRCTDSGYSLRRLQGAGGNPVHRSDRPHGAGRALSRGGHTLSLLKHGHGGHRPGSLCHDTGGPPAVQGETRDPHREGCPGLQSLYRYKYHLGADGNGCPQALWRPWHRLRSDFWGEPEC